MGVAVVQLCTGFRVYDVEASASECAGTAKAVCGAFHIRGRCAMCNARFHDDAAGIECDNSLHWGRQKL